MQTAGADPRVARWLEALEARHLADLRVREVTRALRALSADYVERRHRVRDAALAGRGKRAAFALFYGPLHFMAVDHIVRSLGAHVPATASVIDVGCGTGAAGAAWGTAFAAPPRMLGLDRHPWALAEAGWTYRAFGLAHRTARGDATRLRVTARMKGTAILLAYTVNELADAERSQVLRRLVQAGAAGAAVLIVEPIARALTPWWPEWQAALAPLGGTSAEWRISAPLPPLLRLLDKSAGLDHQTQTARSLWVPPR